MLIKIQQRLQYLDRLISLKCTVSPKELADRLNISERAWYKLRDELVNDLQIPIVYDSTKRSYVYKEPGNIIMGFRKLKYSELADKFGGGIYSHRLDLLKELHYGPFSFTAQLVQYSSLLGYFV